MYISGPQAHLLHKLGGKKDLYVSESLDRVLHHCGHVRADIPVPALVICEMKLTRQAEEGIRCAYLNAPTRAAAGFLSICVRMYVCTDERCAQSRDVLLWTSNLVRPLLTVFGHSEAWEGHTKQDTSKKREE